MHNLEANGGYHEHLRGIRLFFPEELEAALAAASAELKSVHAKLKAVESTLREKKDLQKQLLAYIKTKPARDGLQAQKTEKARRATGSSTKASLSFPNLPPGISRHRESPKAASVQDLTSGD